MPIINITEKDLTVTSSVETTDIPLILSVSARPANAPALPQMYMSVADFQDESSAHGVTCPYIDLDETKYDSAYIMALQLIAKGMPVYYGYVSDLDNDDIVDYIQDKNEVTIKYICVPDMNMLVFGEEEDNTELKADLLTICKKRGDCILLIDCDREFDYKEILDVQTSINATENGASLLLNHEFATTFVPWHSFTLATEVKLSNTETTRTAPLPGSFSYLSALKEATKVTNNWFAIAGVTRGAIPGIGSALVANNRVITNTVANKLQPTITDSTYDGEGDKLDKSKVYFAVNPITKIAPYGSIIWGNRTLKPITQNNIQATHFLNTRNMISDIKKVAYDTAKTLMFNQNDEVLWLDFLSGVTPFLDQLKSGSGIFDYKLIKKPTKERHRFQCEIRIYPVSAVEWFDISVVASDMGVETSEK